MLPAKRFWRETVSLLQVMWPRGNQWERARCWQKKPNRKNSSYMTIRHNDLLGRSAYVVLLLVWTRLNVESVRLHTSTLLLRWFLGFSSWIQMKLSEQRESFCKREKKSAKYSTRQKFWAATSTTTEGVREILITTIKLILFSVKTVWSGFILIIAQDFRADLLYRGNFNPGITWIEAARSRHVYRKIGSSTHEPYVYPLTSCWSGSSAPTWLHSKFPARFTGIPASQSQGPDLPGCLGKANKASSCNQLLILLLFLWLWSPVNSTETMKCSLSTFLNELHLGSIPNRTIFRPKQNLRNRFSFSSFRFTWQPLVKHVTPDFQPTTNKAEYLWFRGGILSFSVYHEVCLLDYLKWKIKILSANVILPSLSLNSKASTDCLRLLFFTDNKNTLASTTHC